MKLSTALLFSCVALVSNAQECHFEANPQPPGQIYGWSMGAVDSDGSVTSAMMPDQGMGVYLTRWAPDGQVIWNRRIQHMDPQYYMTPSGLQALPNGNTLVFGSLYPGLRYRDFFATEVDDDGNALWSRLYMLDSANQQLGGYAVSMLPLPDGGYLFSAANDHGMSVSRLNSDAIPVWTNRYEPGPLESFGGVGSVVDANGDFCHFGQRGTGLFVVHTDPQGTPEWYHTYELGLPEYSAVQSVTLAANGDYLIKGNVEWASIFLIRMDPQGNILWRRSYANMGYDRSSLNELSNGHILLGQYWDPQLVEVDAAGSVLGAWSDTTETYSHGMIAVSPPHGDSLFIGSTRSLSGNMEYPELLISPGTDHLDCAMVPSTTTSTTEANPTFTDALIVVDDSLKTWTMNIATPLVIDELDLSCYLAPTVARPSFTTTVYGVIRNTTGRLCGPITATLIHEQILTYSIATPAPSSVVPGTITWQVPAIPPYSQRLVHARFQLPADPGLIGTPIPYTFSFTQDSVETDLLNNTAYSNTHIVGAYDPNDKLVRPEAYYVLGTDSVLDYTIRFQNTGTASAINVVVVDTLPLDVDVSSFRLGATSHTCTYSLTGNGILKFTFNNINLPDSNANEAASHGLVSFRIKPILPLTVGQEITNAADIYFDFNPPIHTPDATVIVSDGTGVQPAVDLEKLVVFPIPVKNTLTALLPSGFKPVYACATGVDGRRIDLYPTLSEGRASFNTQPLRIGGFVLTLVDRNGRRMSARFTKE